MFVKILEEELILEIVACGGEIFRRRKIAGFLRQTEKIDSRKTGKRDDESDAPEIGERMSRS